MYIHKNREREREREIERERERKGGREGGREAESKGGSCIYTHTHVGIGILLQVYSGVCKIGQEKACAPWALSRRLNPDED